MKRDKAGRFLPRVFHIADPRFLDEVDGSIRLMLDDNGCFFCWVDVVNCPWIFQHRWHAAKDLKGKIYARRTQRFSPFSVYLHREVMLHICSPPSPRHFLVDHMDGDGLNNRIVNLRWTTLEENRGNRYGYYYRQAEFAFEAIANPEK